MISANTFETHRYTLVCLFNVNIQSGALFLDVDIDVKISSEYYLRFELHSRVRDKSLSAGRLSDDNCQLLRLEKGAIGRM